MRAKIAAGAVIAALAVAGTAVAAGGGGPVAGLFGDDHRQEFAEDLAGQLEGVSPNQVEQALDTVAKQRMEEHRSEMAAAIAEQLDGVSADDVAAALKKHEQQVRDAIENGERPEMGSLVTTLADELGKSEDEITDALQAAHEAEAEQHKAEALKRLDQAVEDGDISKKQADQIRERIENGPDFGPHGPGGPGGPGDLGGPGGPGMGPGGPPPGLAPGV
jgi:nucleoid DNA-binding protein